MTTPIAGASSVDQTQTVGSTNSGGQATQDTFLKLLVAQLKYQNPMQPTDSTQFLQQTATFTMVEKLEDIAKQSSDLLTAQHNAEAAGMIGQRVTATDSEGKDITGIVTGMRLTANGPTLKVDGADVNLSSVTEIDRPDQDTTTA